MTDGKYYSDSLILHGQLTNVWTNNGYNLRVTWWIQSLCTSIDVRRGIASFPDHACGGENGLGMTLAIIHHITTLCHVGQWVFNACETTMVMIQSHCAQCKQYVGL